MLYVAKAILATYKYFICRLFAVFVAKNGLDVANLGNKCTNVAQCYDSNKSISSVNEMLNLMALGSVPFNSESRM